MRLVSLRLSSAPFLSNTKPIQSSLFSLDHQSCLPFLSDDDVALKSNTNRDTFPLRDRKDGLKTEQTASISRIALYPSPLAF